MTVDTFISRVGAAVVNPLLLLLFSWAFLVFLWGIFQFVYQADDQEARSTGKTHIWYGIIGMTIMVAAEGIVEIIKQTVANF